MPSERDQVGARGDVVVGIEGRVALSVAAKIHRRNPETALGEHRCEEAVDGAEVAHAGQADDEWACPGDVVGDAAGGAGQVGSRRRCGQGGLGWCGCACGCLHVRDASMKCASDPLGRRRGQWARRRPADSFKLNPTPLHFDVRRTGRLRSRAGSSRP